MSKSTWNRNRSCVSYRSDALIEGLEHLQGLILEDGRNGTIQCPHNQCCFGIWNLTQGQPRAKLQGCWFSENEPCDSSACVSQTAAPMLSCRCQADLCNAHVSYGGPGENHAESLPSPSEIFWIIAACPVLFFLGFLIFLVLRHWKAPAVLLNPEEAGELTKVITTSEQKDKRKVPRQKLPDLQFLQVLHNGQFSKVWQGTFHQQPVAIKVFPPFCYRQFASEWAVHSLPLMGHDNVVQLMAAGCGGPTEQQGGLLVLTLYPLGSLRNFLRQHVCSWDISIRLGSSFARGLAFLHGEQWKEGLHKPGVAHRDLSSQNVLVREDRTCAITDFGLAMTLPVHHERWREGPAEGIIHKVGAPRYIAPEILDETLNLQDLSSALRQADVYSLALVLWEILMRCSALFPENSIPEFQLAYEAELGSNPSYSELRKLAVEERGRPAIPASWRRFGHVAFLQEILEDCWDPEPEARLQAECAQQRLLCLGAEDLVKEY
ncbi:anti-Muellerian hormone type-2 receptor [Varanus komodoensis]|uniref:anti-Muellerian hormone type-2 receptor n=1 Tax=Varanus komodoensis TaxID=61221 RepID=UPI001CF76FB7|nr:anti-Muellerian hormone type-2 receptor [Varanus komodoensis]